MLRLERVALCRFEQEEHHLQRLYAIFEATLQPGMEYRAFRFYYFRHKPHLIDITFIMHGKRTVGFTTAAFYKMPFQKKNIVICRSALGLLPQYQGGNLPVWNLCLKYIRYKCMHPFTRLYIAGFMANPLVYAMMCKYTHLVYPKLRIAVPWHIFRLHDAIVRWQGLHKKLLRDFVLTIHFQVHQTQEAVQRIGNSACRHVGFYLRQNPLYMQQIGILTIIPVSWYNMAVTVCKVFVYKPVQLLWSLIRKKRPSVPAGENG